MNYVTLFQVRQYIRLETGETADDALLTRLIKEISGNIDEWCGRRFDVRQETRYFDYPVKALERFGLYSAENFVYQMNATAQLSSGKLRLDDDLLGVVAITNGNEAAVAAGSYNLEPANTYPKHTIKLKQGYRWLPASDGNREQVISVEGLWGYHTRYTDLAWASSLDTVQNNPLAIGGTTLTVQDADGLSGDGEAQRFQAGQMLKLDDGTNYEFVTVLAVDNGANQLTISRASNGTTAREWPQTTPVYLYRPMENIVRAARRWVKYVYRQKDTDVLDTTHILGTGIKITPSTMPPDVKALLPPPRRGLDQEGLL